MHIKRFAVLGNPVGHSLSPRIHAAFAAQFRLAIDYTAERVEIANGVFESRVGDFFAVGGGGLNITLPFKARAAQMAARPTAGVRLTGAANTLWIREGELCADNTDGPGWWEDIRRLSWDLRGARVLVLGAGGAVAGILPQLLAGGIAGCCLCNRTLSKAEELAANFAEAAGQAGVELSYGDMRTAQTTGADLLINALSIHADFSYDSLRNRPSLAYDLSYSLPHPTAFCAAMREAGIQHVTDGLGMLVYQGAKSFAIWHGMQPDAAPVLRQLRP